MSHCSLSASALVCQPCHSSDNSMLAHVSHKLLCLQMCYTGRKDNPCNTQEPKQRSTQQRITTRSSAGPTNQTLQMCHRGEGRVSLATPKNQNNDQPIRGQLQEAVRTRNLTNVYRGRCADGPGGHWCTHPPNGVEIFFHHQ